MWYYSFLKFNSVKRNQENQSCLYMAEWIQVIVLHLGYGRTMEYQINLNKEWMLELMGSKKYEENSTWRWESWLMSTLGRVWKYRLLIETWRKCYVLLLYWSILFYLTKLLNDKFSYFIEVFYFIWHEGTLIYIFWQYTITLVQIRPFRHDC